MAISQEILDGIKNGSITELNLHNSALNDADIAELVKVLDGNSKVTKIDLSYNSFSVKGARQLAKLLKKNSSIADLNLGNPTLFGGEGLGDEGVKIIAEALADNSTLTSLNIESQRFGDEGTVALAEALKANATLKELNLHNNRMGAQGVQAIASLMHANNTISSLDISSRNIGPKEASVIAKALAANTTLTSLGLGWSGGEGIGAKGATDIAKALKVNKTLRKLDLSHQRIGTDGYSALADAIKVNSGLVTLWLQYSDLDYSGLTALKAALEVNNNICLTAIYGCKNIDEEDQKQLKKTGMRNRGAAIDLLYKIQNGIAELNVQDIDAINERIPAIVATVLDGDLNKYGKAVSSNAKKLKPIPMDDFLTALSQLQDKAIEMGREIVLPHDIEMLMRPFQQAHETKRQKHLATEAAAHLKRVAAIAERHSVSIEELIGSNPTKPFALDEIEAMLAFTQAKPNQEVAGLSNVTQARLELASHEIIPHLDYFLITALRAMDKPEEVDFAQYPNIQRVAGTQYDLSKFKQQARNRQAEGSTLNFDYLRDPSQGDHMTRLRRALGEVNGTIGQYEGMFKKMEDEIAGIYLKIDQSRGLADEKGRYLAEAKKGNEFRTDRMHEYSIRADSTRLSAEVRNQERARATLGQSIAYGLAKFSKGVPFLEGITESISEHVGHPNLGNSKALTRATSAAARVDAEAAEAIIEYYQGKQVDTDAIEHEIKIVQNGIKKMQQDQGLKRFEQDKTKQKAVAEAFVNKLMLTFGQHMSENLLAVCEEHGIDKIDNFFAAFDGDPRLKEAFTNLGFGYADSNDLSVIFAEVAALKGDSPAHKAAAEFVETVLKPNVDSLYMHASKVDLIYQANLTGLGTDLHNARHMIRGEHDMRVRALFGDSFGVDSEMGALTIRGAVDVKNLFDYYMHRHGKTTLTDTKIHDGLVTGNTAPKGVSVLTDTAMGKHKELAKASRGYRQDGPDISDMFLRICGYEYFCPQAPNGMAQGNIMANNPEAPASYQMTNRVIQDFIKKLSFSHIDDYRAKVGTKADEASKLDNLIAQTFMDFFAEVGAIHAADPKLGGKRADLKAAAKETGTFGFAFDSYERQITKDALGRFDLFLEIYKRNLENQLRDASVADGQLLREQITAIAGVTNQQLNPPVVEPGSESNRHRARLANHTFENTHWRGAM